MSHIFSDYDCQLIVKKLVDKKNDKVEFDLIPKENEEYDSLTYGCIRFIDSNRFLSSSSDEIVKTLDFDDFQILRKKFPDKWIYLK